MDKTLLMPTQDLSLIVMAPNLLELVSLGSEQLVLGMEGKHNQPRGRETSEYMSCLKDNCKEQNSVTWIKRHNQTHFPSSMCSCQSMGPRRPCFHRTQNTLFPS